MKNTLERTCGGQVRSSQMAMLTLQAISWRSAFAVEEGAKLCRAFARTGLREHGNRAGSPARAGPGQVASPSP